MNSRIEDLCFINDAPSKEIIQTVRNMLVKPLQDLKDLDLEILTLEQRLQELKNKRNDVDKLIARCRPILSPIRTLSPDVLGEIFQHCLPFHTNPVLKATECPLMLTQVCRLWRTVALSRPRLWSRIHIVFTELDYLTSPASIRDQAILQQRLDAIKQWLSHSGTRPLSLSINFLTPRRDPEFPPMTMDLLQFLSQLCPRFEDLELAMPLEAFRRLESMINVSQMTRLTSVRKLSLHRRTGLGPTEPILLLQAPNLRQVTTFGPDTSIWGVTDPSYLVVWSRLTHITCDTWFSKGDIVYLLNHTANLVHLAVTIFDPRMDGHESDDPIMEEPDDPIMEEPDDSVPYISLPFLQTIFLTDLMSSEHRGDLYERINAPALRYVMFNNNAPETDDSSNSNPVPIVPLLRQARLLKKLSINLVSIDQWDIRSMFSAIPTITHLFFGYEARNTDGSIRRIPLSDLDPHPFDFELLSSRDNLPLLPNLQSFEMNNQLIIINDEDLLRFMKFRMSPPLGSGMSALKHLACVFYRPQGHDLVKEIRTHAMHRAVKMISLALNFTEPLEEKKMVPAPESGLRTLATRLGNYMDVVEYMRYHRLDSETVF